MTCWESKGVMVVSKRNTQHSLSSPTYVVYIYKCCAIAERNDDAQEEVFSSTNIQSAKKIGNQTTHVAPSCDLQLANAPSTNHQETCRCAMFPLPIS